jgi:carboxyl-terminal processing protease
MIVYTEGRSADSKERYFANPGDELEQVPMVVLINQRSASASEIVAAALQDHQRALILGEKSYGKGVVQSILPIQNNAAIKLTTARYFTPKGRNIDGLGVEPDVVIEPSEIADGKDYMLDRALILLSEQLHSKL